MGLRRTHAQPVTGRWAARRARSLAAIALVVLMLPGPTSACGYHVALAGGISTAHAASIPVALAVRAAVDAGRMSAMADAPAPLALVRANGAMRTFAVVLERGVAGLPPVALVLVEAHLWGRITPGSSGARFDAHVAGPDAGDVVVVTGEPVLRALLDGRLGWDAALAAGLVVVDGPAQARDRLAHFLAQRFT